MASAFQHVEHLASAKTGEEAQPAAVLINRMNRLVARVASRVPDRALLDALEQDSTPELLATFLDLAAMAGEFETDPVGAARLRGREALLRLIERTGGAWTPGEATKQLGVSREALRQWREGRRVLALPTTEGFRYPVAQFATGGLGAPRPYGELREVLVAAGEGLTAEELFAMLSRPLVAIDDARTGWEVLAAQDREALARLIDALRHRATPLDPGTSAA
jgi:hypothetical protein